MSPSSSRRRRLVPGATAVAATAALLATTLQVGSAAAVTTHDAAVAHARTNVTANASVFGFGTDQDLQVKDVIIDPDGTQHVRFDRTYRGLPVVGGDLVVHQDAKGRLKDSTRAAAHDAAVRTTVPAVPAEVSAGRALGSAPGIAAGSSTPS